MKGASKAAAKKGAAKDAAVKKPAAKKAAVKKPVAKKAAAKKPVAKKASANKPVAKTSATRKSGRKAGLFGVPGLSPKAPAPLEHPGDEAGAKARTGYVSKRAKSVAKQRGFEESRTKVIQSHVSASARRNQAKRDKR